MDPAAWPRAKQILAAMFKQRSRDEWVRVSTDRMPALRPCSIGTKLPQHPHLRERETLIEIDGIVQPAPAPRFSRTVPATPAPPAPLTPENTQAGLEPWCGAEADYGVALGRAH